MVQRSEVEEFVLAGPLGVSLIWREIKHSKQEKRRIYRLTLAEGGMWGNYVSFHWKWGPGERKRTLQPVHIVFWFVSIEMWGTKSLNNMLPIIETPLKPLTVFFWFPSYMQKATYFFNVCFGTLDLDHWDVRVKPHKLVLPKVMCFFF